MNKKRPISRTNKWLWGIFCLGVLIIASGIFCYAIALGGMFTVTSQDEMDNFFKAIAVTTIVVVVYLIPTIFGRKKRNAASIAVFNVYLGWTVIGWVVALVWASLRDKDLFLPTRRIS